MRLFETKLNVTSEGVFRPTNLWVGILGCAIIVGLLARQLYFEKIPLYAAALFVLLVITVPIFKRIKYGEQGMPYIKISSNQLIMFLPADSHGNVRFDVASLCEIQIYGRLKKRKFRFIQTNGTFADVTPYFSKPVEHAVIHFLATNLPSQIGVKICEPQSFFEEVRGDGP